MKPDWLTHTSFQKDIEGNTLFFPYGWLGPGYLLQSEIEFLEAIKFERRSLIAYLFSCVFVALFLNMFIGIFFSIPLSLLFGAAIFHLSIRKFVSRLPKSPEKFSQKQATYNSIKYHKLSTLVLMELALIAYVVLVLRWFFDWYEDPWLWSFVVGSLLLCCFWIGYLIYRKIRERRNGGDS